MFGSQINPKTEFYLALQNKDLIALQQLLTTNSHPIDVDIKFKVSSRNKPAVCISIEQGCYDAVELLLDSGCSVNESDCCGWTPLHYACRRGRADIVRLLLDAGADINRVNDEKNTPLHLATYSSTLAIVELLIQRYRGSHIEEMVNRRNYQNQTALIIACLNGNRAVTEYLLLNVQNIDTNVMDNEGNCALFHAIKCGSSTVRCLLSRRGGGQGGRASERGGCIVRRRCWGAALQPPLHMAIINSQDTSDDLLSIQMLVDAGCDMNDVNKLRQTALMVALQGGKLNIAKMLIRSGKCQLSTRDLLGTSPLRRAVADRLEGVIRLMLEMGVNLREETWVREYGGMQLARMVSEDGGGAVGAAGLWDTWGVPRLARLARRVIQGAIREYGKPALIDTLPLPKPLIKYVKLNQY